jgi:RNA-directed DNA polymerase
MAINESDLLHESLLHAWLQTSFEIPELESAVRHVVGKDWPALIRACTELFQFMRTLSYAQRRCYLPVRLARHEAFQTLIVNTHSRPRMMRLVLEERSLPVSSLPFSSWNLPKLESKNDLASLFEITPEQLERLLCWSSDHRAIKLNSRIHYRFKPIRKKRGWRLLEIPQPWLKGVQVRLLHKLLGKIPVHDAAKAFVPGRSLIDHVRLHSGQALLLKLDVQDFFPSFTLSRVAGLFRTLGYREDIAYFLAVLCTCETPREVSKQLLQLNTPPFPQPSLNQIAERARLQLRRQQPHLPQGAPTSPALANCCAWRLDVRLSGLAASKQLRYSRYADDIVFSASKHQVSALKKLFPICSRVLHEEGFVLQARKTQWLYPSQSMVVCGLTANVVPNLPRAEWERWKACLHRAHQNPPATLELREQFLQKWRGRIAWIQSFHTQKATKLKLWLDQLSLDSSA